jgi:predicted chitinase
MAIEHDSSTGFLRGESIADEVEQLAQELKLLRQIESNTSAIVKHLGGLSQRRPAVQPEPAGARRASISTSAAANDPASPRSPSRSGGGSSGRPVSERMAATPRQAGTRDASGRFTGGSSSARGASADGSMGPGAAQAIGSSIVDAAKDMSSKLTADVDNVDPAIQAAKEVSSLLSPALSLFKPLGRLFGRDKDAKQTKEHRENVTWLRRIWRGQEDANKGKGRGGMGGMLGMLLALVGAVLAPFKALGRLLGASRLLKAASSLLPGRRSRRSSRGGDVGGRSGRGRDNSHSRNALSADGSPIDGKGKAAAAAAKDAKNAAKAASATKGGGLKGLLKSMGGGAAKLGKGLLKKIPFIGALFGGAMLASDAMADDDPNLSPEENKKNKWGNVGSGVGGIVGGLVGMLGGPAGVIAGGIIGDALGGLVGEWLSTVDLDAIPGKIGDAFNSLKDGALEAATAAFNFVSDGFKGFLDVQAKAFTAVGQWIKDAWNKATDAVLGVKDTVMDKVQDGKDYVADKASSVADAGSNMLYKATGGKFGSSSSNAAKDQLIQAMDAGGITDPKSKAMLMANVDHESGGFTKKEENLNYSAKRLQEVFPKYYKDAESARADANNPEAIANKVYGGRMGNKDPGDGYKFRGRGALQLTGRAQYEEMGKKLGVDLVNNPELAADPKYSAQIAVQHWKSSGADKAAQAGDMVKARKLTNGGTNGLADVQKKYEETYLAQAKAGDLTPTRRADEMKVAAPAAVGTAVASTMAAVASPKSLAGAQAATPIGIMAPSQVRPVSVANNAIPATLAAPKVASYAPAAADASQVKIPSMAEVKAPPPGSGGGKEGPTTVNLETPLSQNVQDRSIAHVSAGGIGMQL